MTDLQPTPQVSLHFTGAYRARIILGSCRFHRQIQVQDLQCSFKIYTSGSLDTGICYTAKLSENFDGPHYRFSRFRNVFQVLVHLQVRLIIISRKNENHMIRVDKEYGK